MDPSSFTQSKVQHTPDDDTHTDVKRIPVIDLRFQGHAIQYDCLRQFPAGTIKTVVVSIKDDAPFAVAPVDPIEGHFHISLRLPESGDALRDTIKFHFYSHDDILLAAGWVEMGLFIQQLIDTSPRMQSGNPVPGLLHSTSEHPIMTAYHNYETHNRICMWVRGTDYAAAQESMEAFRQKPPTRSALMDTKRYMHLYLYYLRETKERLRKELRVDAANGGTMVMALEMFHAMDGQVTSPIHFQLEMDPTDAQLDLIIESGMHMYFISDTLHFLGKTAGEILASFNPADSQGSNPKTKGDVGLAITRFLSSAIQTPQRSIWTAPYFPDMTDSLLPDGVTVRMNTSEHFKRLLGMPFGLGRAANGASNGALSHDDCDGWATNLHVLTMVYRRLYERMNSTQTGSSSFSSLSPDINDPSLHELLFPAALHIFPEDDPNSARKYRTDLIAISNRIGKDIYENKIKSMIAGVTMMGADMSADHEDAGDHKKSSSASSQNNPAKLQLGGHMLHTLQSRHMDPESPPINIINEGTNLFFNEPKSVMIHLRVKRPMNDIEQDHPVCGEEDDNINRYVTSESMDRNEPRSDSTNKTQETEMEEEDVMRVNMSDVVNELSHHLIEHHPDKSNCRTCFHISNLKRESRYVAFFFQGGEMIGQRILPEITAGSKEFSSVNVIIDAENGFGPDENQNRQSHTDTNATLISGTDAEKADQYIPSATKERILFGLAATELNNYSIRTHIDAEDRTTHSEEDRKFMEQHRIARKIEIHPPLVPMDLLREYLQQSWSPMTMYRGHPALEGREFMTCLASECFHNPSTRQNALEKANERVAAFNRHHVTSTMGIMHAYISTNAVVTCVCLYIDSAEAIATSLKMALKVSIQDRMMRTMEAVLHLDNADKPPEKTDEFQPEK